MPDDNTNYDDIEGIETGQTGGDNNNTGDSGSDSGSSSSFSLTSLTNSTTNFISKMGENIRNMDQAIDDHDDAETAAYYEALENVGSGNKMDEDGNIVDKDGNILVKKDDVVMDAFGNFADKTGEIRAEIGDLLDEIAGLLNGLFFDSQDIVETAWQKIKEVGSGELYKANPIDANEAMEKVCKERKRCKDRAKKMMKSSSNFLADIKKQLKDMMNKKKERKAQSKSNSSLEGTNVKAMPIQFRKMWEELLKEINKKMKKMVEKMIIDAAGQVGENLNSEENRKKIKEAKEKIQALRKAIKNFMILYEKLMQALGFVMNVYYIAMDKDNVGISMPEFKFDLKEFLKRIKDAVLWIVEQFKKLSVDIDSDKIPINIDEALLGKIEEQVKKYIFEYMVKGCMCLLKQLENFMKPIVDKAVGKINGFVNKVIDKVSETVNKIDAKTKFAQTLINQAKALYDRKTEQAKQDSNNQVKNKKSGLEKFLGDKINNLINNKANELKGNSDSKINLALKLAYKLQGSTDPNVQKSVTNVENKANTLSSILKTALSAMRNNSAAISTEAQSKIDSTCNGASKSIDETASNCSKSCGGCCGRKSNKISQKASKVIKNVDKKAKITQENLETARNKFNSADADAIINQSMQEAADPIDTLNKVSEKVQDIIDSAENIDEFIKEQAKILNPNFVANDEDIDMDTLFPEGDSFEVDSDIAELNNELEEIYNNSEGSMTNIVNTANNLLDDIKANYGSQIDELSNSNESLINEKIAELEAAVEELNNILAGV